MVFVFKTIRAVVDVLKPFKRRITGMVENMMFFLRELQRGARSLLREKGLTATIVFTLALGIGANAVMFSLVRGVLLRPLVNRDEASLIYIRQSSAGGNVAFSMPDIQDLRSRVKTLSSFGDFSVIGFSMVGLGEPRQVNAGVVGGSYFRVMGLRPVLGRLLDESDDGEKAAGVVVLTYRFWTTALKGDPKVIGKTIRLDSFIDSRSATIVGVLEPSVPYPQGTQIIANVVTSAHHLSVRARTSGGQSPGRSKDAGSAASRRLGLDPTACGHYCLSRTRHARSPSRCDSGAANGVTCWMVAHSGVASDLWVNC